ncbi:MAG: hypothetical protein PSX37_04375 [bacterium]|nr:hypothetical protein [bacterium]
MASIRRERDDEDEHRYGRREQSRFTNGAGITMAVAAVRQCRGGARAAILRARFSRSAVSCGA